MVSVAKEDLEAIQKKNPRLIFLVGPKGSGKNSQSQKIVNEFKYSKIKMGELIKNEIDKDTEFGKAAKEAFEKKELIADDIAANILLHGIIQAKTQSILIEGFPKTMQQALYFEQNILPIKLIMNFTVSVETAKKRLEELSKKQGVQFDAQAFAEQYAEHEGILQPLLEFYNKYNIVRNVDAEKPIGAVNDQVKQNLYPVIYSIIGKRYAGKTELSKVLNTHTGIELIDFGEFVKQPDIAKRAADNNFVVSAFIAKLRGMETTRVLIENFPQNKDQYSYFVNNCKGFETIYYLDADNSSSLQRLNSLSITDPNYTDCSELDKMLYDFEQQKAFIDFLRKKTKFLEIDVNNHKVLTIQSLINKIQPYCVIIKADEALAESKKAIVDKLIANYSYEVVDINEVIENGQRRKIATAEKEEITNEDKISLIRSVLFRENRNKFILENFPTTIEELSAFESSLCKISKMIYISDDVVLNNIENEKSIEVFFKDENKFVLLTSKETSDYQIEESLDMTRDINIVYGMPLSGKTAIAKHMQKSGFTLLDFKELIEEVKKTKIDPENPDAEPEIAFPDLVKGLKDYLEKEPLTRRVVVDNFFIPNAPEPFLIDTYEKALEIIQTIGHFRNLYEIDCTEETLINRYKAKEGLTEELSEDQKAAFNETCDKPKQLLEEIKKLSANVIKVDTNEPEPKSILLFDFTFGRNFIVIKHEYDINIENTLKLFASRHKMMYINVPQLIYSHFEQNDADSNKLEASYGKKVLANECKDENDFNRFIYYKYNPIHFEPGLVNSLILKYANDHYKEIEKTGNFILLTGYLNVDLLQESDLPFNLPLLELKNVMELGDLTSFIQITRGDIKVEEDEEAIQLVIEKPKKVVQKDPLDVDGEEGEKQEGEEEPQEEPQEEEEENPDGVPKFKPEEYKWTSYDGVPRNYVQVLKRLKMYPVTKTESTLDHIGEDVEKILIEHLDNFNKRHENHYKGIIEIVKMSA